LWDIERGEVIRTFGSHANLVLSVAFSPDGTRVLTGSDDGTARICDLGEEVAVKDWSLR